MFLFKSRNFQVLCLLGCISAYSASIEGKLTNADGDPVPGVEVILVDVVVQDTLRAVSGITGYFDWASTIFVGTYALHLVHGQDTIADTIEVDDEEAFISREYVLPNAVHILLPELNCSTGQDLFVISEGHGSLLKIRSLTTGSYSLVIRNSAGKVVDSYKANGRDLEISTARWNKGIYFFSYKSSDGEETLKFEF